MKDTGDSKAGWLEDAAAIIDTSDCDYMSNCSDVSNTRSDSQEKEFYILYKCFLQQTKAMKDLDLEKYFLFIQSASHLIKQSGVQSHGPEIFRLKKHMGKARKQLNL